MKCLISKVVLNIEYLPIITIEKRSCQVSAVRNLVYKILKLYRFRKWNECQNLFAALENQKSLAFCLIQKFERT